MRFLSIAAALLIGPAWGQNPADRGARLLEEANAHYRASRPSEAIRLYREYLAAYPDRPDVRVYLGGALLNLNDPEGALAEARRALALNERFSKAYTLAGRIHADQSEWKVADEFFARAVEIDPSDRDAWYFRGRALYEAQQFEQALTSLQRAASLGVESSQILEKIGLAYEALGRFQEADRAYARAVKIAGSNYRAYFAYGAFLFKQTRTSEAAAMLEHALRLNPGSAEVRFEVGRLFFHAGRFDQAAEALAGEVPPAECRIYNLRGRILVMRGAESDAGREFASFQDCQKSAEATARTAR
jgi:tetratricopeptide (TPR) repeat protein